MNIGERIIGYMGNKKVLLQTDWFTIESREYPEFDDKPFLTMVTSNGVVILTLTPEEKIVLVRQFRPALGKYTLEVPAGTVNEFESPEAAVERELYEETGFRCHKVVQLNPRLAVMENRISAYLYPFLGTGAKQDRDFRPKEKIQVVLVTLEEFKKLLICGEFSMTASAVVTLARLQGDCLKNF